MSTASIGSIIRTYVPFFFLVKSPRTRSIFDIPEEEPFVLTKEFANELIKSGHEADMVMSHIDQEMAFFPRKIGESIIYVLWEVQK
jgi:hypothetical protein